MNDYLSIKTVKPYDASIYCLHIIFYIILPSLYLRIDRVKVNKFSLLKCFSFKELLGEHRVSFSDPVNGEYGRNVSAIKFE